ncbi:MAG TPA: tyrosine-type recombinase/integrase [Terriglobales bacterium]|nr:tyrosine-type recombinase/integrase [Terriglobales bacterium]
MRILPIQTKVTVYVRHRDSCPKTIRGEFYPNCDCAKWLRYSLRGKQRRQPAHTRTWSIAQEKALDLQNRLQRGDSPVKLSPGKAAQTIQETVETFIVAKHTQNITASTIRKLRHQLNLFETFMTQQSKFYPADITADDVINFRASWTWSDMTKIKAQQNLRGFLRFACKDNRTEVLDALGTIKETREGQQRRKPKPFSEAEIKKLLENAPEVFASEPAKIQKIQTMIRLMVSTGLAIIDTVQLERTAVQRAQKTGVLEVERQKTGKPATIPIPAALLKELSEVLNGNPQYVFWDGKYMADSETKVLQKDMRRLMKATGVYIKGNVFHRFRDSAVDTWIGLGWSMTDIATALGDTVTIVERHYKDWASQRMKERMARLPVRQWEPALAATR